MAIELYCDGFVEDTTQQTKGACIHCGCITEDQEKGYMPSDKWQFVCRDCSNVGDSEPFAADFR